MSRPGPLRIPTYRQVWRQERILYQIERVRLPFPISFRQLGTFAVAVLVMIVLGRLPGLRTSPGLVRYVGLPALVTWYLTRQTLDGKPPLLWLRSMFRYYFGPKRLHGLGPAPRARRAKPGKSAQ